jgi:hypothetical protein
MVERELRISKNKASSSFSGLVSGRGADRLPQDSFTEPPWRGPTAKLRWAGSSNKRSGLHFIHIEILLLLLACRGGEGDKDWSSVVRVNGRSLALGVRPCFARLKLRILEFSSGRYLASPLSMADGATPAARFIPGIYFLQDAVPTRRIFPDPGKGLIASADPSGKFPGGNASSYALWSFKRGGEDDGLDCFLQLFPRVFSVKVLPLSAVILTCRGFTVTCTHRLD